MPNTDPPSAPPSNSWYECADCEWRTEDEDAFDPVIHKFHERVFEGEICPAGTCPECDGLVHLENPQTRAMSNTTEMLAFLAQVAGGNTEYDELSAKAAEILEWTNTGVAKP